MFNNDSDLENLARSFGSFRPNITMLVVSFGVAYMHLHLLAVDAQSGKYHASICQTDYRKTRNQSESEDPAVTTRYSD